MFGPPVLSSLKDIFIKKKKKPLIFYTSTKSVSVDKMEEAQSAKVCGGFLPPGPERSVPTSSLKAAQAVVAHPSKPPSSKFPSRGTKARAFTLCSKHLFLLNSSHTDFKTWGLFFFFLAS